MTMRTRISRRLAPLAVAAAATGAIAPGAIASCFCAGDVDGDRTVGFPDLLAVLAQWGPCEGECPADLDENGVVDFDDLLLVLSNWGPCVFDYGPPRGDAEAEQIGLESLGAAGPLLVPDEVYGRIVRDLELIRAFEPALEGEIHAPAWVPDHLIVKRVPEAPQEEYAALNCFYEANERRLFGDWYLLTLPGNVNVPALALIYVALDAVEIAEPDFWIGGENFWIPSDQGGGLWRWEVDDGFLDCPDGCDCHRRYVFEVEADGTVRLIDYREEGPPYCEF